LIIFRQFKKYFEMSGKFSKKFLQTKEQKQNELEKKIEELVIPEDVKKEIKEFDEMDTDSRVQNLIQKLMEQGKLEEVELKLI
jgi:hypothetical protein